MNDFFPPLFLFLFRLGLIGVLGGRVAVVGRVRKMHWDRRFLTWGVGGKGNGVGRDTSYCRRFFIWGRGRFMCN